MNRHKPRSIRRQRAIERQRRRTAKAMRKANKQRANKAVHALTYQTLRQWARLQRLSVLSAQTRAKYVYKHKQGSSTPLRVLPPPPIRFLPEWKPKPVEPIEGEIAA